MKQFKGLGEETRRSLTELEKTNPRKVPPAGKRYRLTQTLKTNRERRIHRKDPSRNGIKAGTDRNQQG